MPQDDSAGNAALRVGPQTPDFLKITGARSRLNSPRISEGPLPSHFALGFKLARGIAGASAFNEREEAPAIGHHLSASTEPPVQVRPRRVSHVVRHQPAGPRRGTLSHCARAIAAFDVVPRRSAISRVLMCTRLMRSTSDTLTDLSSQSAGAMACSTSV